MSIQDVFSYLGLEVAPAGVLWDMDGTIIDSEADWVRFSGVVVERHGGTWTDEDGVFIFGASTQDHANRLVEAVLRGAGSSPEPMELFAELKYLMRTEAYAEPELLPGAHEVLAAMSEAGIAQSLVTATPRDLVEPILANLPQKYFDATVCGDDGVPGKPDPAPYNLGAKRLGLAAGECIAFEDSRTGLAAARASGATTFDVAEFPIARLAQLLSKN